MFATLGAFAPIVFIDDEYDNHKQEGSEEQRKCDNGGGVIAIIFLFALHRAVEALSHSLHSLHHAGVPIIVFEIWHHVALLDALADGIGQVAFETISGGKLHRALLGGKKNHKSVVAFFLADTIFLAEFQRKIKRVAPFDVAHHHHESLNPGFLFEIVERGVDGIHCLGRQDIVGIGAVFSCILEMNHRNLLHLIFLGIKAGEGKNKANKPYQRKISHNSHYIMMQN